MSHATNLDSAREVGTTSAPPQLRRRAARREGVLRAIILLVIGLFFAIPLISMFVFSVRFPLTGQWTGDAWASIFSMDSTTGSGTDLSILWEGVRNSLVLVVITTGIMLALLLPTMIHAELTSRRLARIIEFVSVIPLTIPAIVLVVGLAPIYRWLGTHFGTGSAWLSLAYVVLVLPYAYRALDVGLKSIKVSTLVEAARSLGAGWGTVLLRVIIPNMWPAILSASFISVAVVLGEFTLANLLDRNNLQTALFLLGQSDSLVATAMALLALAFGFLLILGLDVVTSLLKGRRRG